MSFLNTTDYSHALPKKTAVLLVNLGTPQAANAKAVRKYLAQFLSDPRVVEIPRLAWMMILHGIILRVRPAKSAKKYATIWTEKGSPLAIHTANQTAALAERIQKKHPTIRVTYAMNYGQPALIDIFDDLVRKQGVDQLLLLPLYPQYSATTTASIWDAIARHIQKLRNPPELRLIKHYHDDKAYIAALADQVNNHWKKHPWDKHAKKMLVLSFHGLPQRNLILGDPYHCECYKTARLLRESLGLSAEEMKVTFQSRFGRAAWLQPYTEPTLIEMAKTQSRVDVFCPGFTSDCLETLEEIAIEAKEAFLNAGGNTYFYIPALNDNKLWIDALESLVTRHIQGWYTDAEDINVLNQRQAAAKAIGALH